MISPPSTMDAFLSQLHARGARFITRVRFKENRTRLLSLSRDGRTLYVHVIFHDAPAHVLDAIAAFLGSRRGSPAHAAAVAEIRGWARRAEAAMAPAAAASAAHRRSAAEPRPGPCCATPAQRSFLASEYRRLNQEHFGGRLPHDLPIRLSRRMSRRLGHVRYHRRADGTRVVVELALNPDLLLEGNEAELRSTLLHEMAHVEAWLVHGHAHHGAVWKRIARRVGCEPRACTRAPVRRRKRGAPPPVRVPARLA